MGFELERLGPLLLGSLLRARLFPVPAVVLASGCHAFPESWPLIPLGLESRFVLL